MPNGENKESSGKNTSKTGAGSPPSISLPKGGGAIRGAGHLTIRSLDMSDPLVLSTTPV
jgi:hypothetical protein